MTLEQEIHKDMINIYEEALEQTGYRASRFIQMVSSEGGLKTAKLLINKIDGSDGYLKLLEMKRLDLTVEYLIIHGIEGNEGKYKTLFTEEEIAKCEVKL